MKTQLPLLQKFGWWMAGIALAFLVLLSFIPSLVKAQNMSHVTSAYNFSFTAIDGKPMPLENYRGKVLLIVNTASKCGFTGQYEGLETLYETYKDQGLVVIGVPSNDFGGQEPAGNADIQKFVCTEFHVTFPLTEKVDVIGDSTHPFYRWAAEQKIGNFLTYIPRWNFHKYLIGRNGSLLASFAAITKPDSKNLKKQIEAALARP